MSITEVVQTISGGWWKFASLLLKSKRYLKKKLPQLDTTPGLFTLSVHFIALVTHFYIVTSNQVAFVRDFLHHYHLDDIFLDIIPTKGLFRKSKVLKNFMQRERSEQKTIHLLRVTKFATSKPVTNACAIISVGYGFNSLEGINRYRPEHTAKNHCPCSP